MRQRDLSPLDPVGVVKRSDAGRVKTLLETGEHSTYNVEIEDIDSRAQRNGRLHGLPLALGSVAVAFLTLIDSVKLDR